MRRLLSTAAVTVALVLVAGCGGSSDGESSGAEGSGGGAGAVADEGGAAADSAADRQVVTTATASVVVDDPAEAAQRVSELVESAGGRVDERTEQAAGGDAEPSADLVVRAPSGELTDVLAELENLGEVANVSVSRSDVTGQTVDLEARISALQTSVARLQTLMDGAGSTEALLAAEGALSGRQEQLESLQSQRAFLADQVELSTLRVQLRPDGVAPPGGPDGFVDALGTGWRALVSAAGGAVVVLGVLLPWLAVAAVLAVAVLVPLRRARRRAALPAATPAAEA